LYSIIYLPFNMCKPRNLLCFVSHAVNRYTEFASHLSLSKEEFEDTKGVIRIRKSKTNRQHIGQKKKDKKTNNDLQNIYIKLKID